MSVKYSFQILVVVVAAIIAFVAVAYLKAPDPANLVNEGRLPPLEDVTFYDLDGKEARLSDYEGKVLLVNLWATWCPPCVAELPSLDIIQAGLGDKGLRVMAISLDRDKTADELKAFLQGRGVEYLHAYVDTDRAIPLKWKYAGVPVTFLIDRTGAVIRQYEGAADWASDPHYRDIEAALTAGQPSQ